MMMLPRREAMCRGVIPFCQEEQQSIRRNSPFSFKEARDKQWREGRESYICAGTVLGNSLFNRAVREGYAAKGCRQKLKRACRRAPTHGLCFTRGSGKGILTAGSMSSALQQQHQHSQPGHKVPKSFQGCMAASDRRET